MKNQFLLYIMSAIGFLSLQSCEGPEGPRGLPGSDVVAKVFEYENVDFDTSTNTKLATVSFVHNVDKMYSGDVILIYVLDGTVDGSSLWVPLPKIYYVNFDGNPEEFQLEYSYSFTEKEFTVSLSSDVDLNNFDDKFTKKQVFRVVYIPGDDPITIVGVSGKSSLKVYDYDSIIKKYKINESDVIKVN